MKLSIIDRSLDDVVILDLTRRITIGEGTLLVRERIEKLLGRGDRTFLLNLVDVDYIDSSGLGELVSTFTTVHNQDGVLKLLGLTYRVRDLMQITKLLTVFDVYDDETEALKSFRSVLAVSSWLSQHFLVVSYQSSVLSD
jgi:anti-sigma B factor antagonist